MIFLQLSYFFAVLFIVLMIIIVFALCRFRFIIIHNSIDKKDYRFAPRAYSYFAKKRKTLKGDDHVINSIRKRKTTDGGF